MTQWKQGFDDPRYTGTPDVWNPAAPPAPGEAAWGHIWQPQRFTSNPNLGGSDGGIWRGEHNQSYRWYEPDTREFYEKNPTQAYQGFLQFGFGDNQRPLLDYAKSYYSRAYANALAGEEAATATPGQVTPPGNGAQWVDYLTPDLVNQIRQSFQMQSAGNRGVTNTFMPQGRWAGNY